MVAAGAAIWLEDGLIADAGSAAAVGQAPDPRGVRAPRTSLMTGRSPNGPLAARAASGDRRSWVGGHKRHLADG